MTSKSVLKAATLTIAILLGTSPGPVAAKSSASAAGKSVKPDKPGKPDKGDPGDKGGNDNKPAKVSWTPQRISMSDVGNDGAIVVQVSADKEVLGVSLFASGSLRGVIGLPDSFDIPAGESVEVEFELLETPADAGHTIGGTIQAMSGGKHLAKPLTFSLKRDSSSTTPDDGFGDELTNSDGSLPVSWLSEDGTLVDITSDLFDETGMATITMVANRDLENVGLWFTPSVSPCISAAFDTEAAAAQDNSAGDGSAEASLVFDDDGNIEFVAAGTEVPVLLTLTDPTEWTCGGGTLHARSSAGNARSFPQIAGVRFDKGEDVTDDSGATEIVAPEAVVDAASFEQAPLSASQIVSIFGLGLGPKDQTVFQLDDEGKISSYLNGTMVLFDGYPAPLLSASAGQINAIVPAAVKGGDVELQVLYGDQQSAPFPVPLGRPTPSLFTVSGNQAAAVNNDGTLNGRSNPAAPDSVVLLFGTGGGPTRTPLPDGAVASEAVWLSSDVHVFVGGLEADLLYAGVAPGLVSAVVQYNIRLNPLTPKGAQPVKVVINGVESAGTETIAVR